MRNINRQSYSATVELAFDYNGNRTPIQSEKINYIMVEHDYQNQVLPIIYITFAVSSDLYGSIIKYKEEAKFYLDIKKSNKNSSSPISKSILSGTFNYIPSTTNPNFREVIDDPSTIEDASYRKIMVGLVSIELTNALRQSFNGVYNNIDQKTLIAMALEGTKCVIESVPYNKKYSSILIPPLASRYKFLEYIFNKDNFFDTKFIYFMDFERSYLISKNGEPVEANDGQLSSIILDIRSVTEEEAYYDGIEIKNGSYYVYVNPANSNVSLDEGTEKIANQIVAVNENNIETQKIDLDINNTVGSTTKQTFMRIENPALYKNELETNTVAIEVVKKYIDGSIFSPNKSILINNYGDYSKYNGKYYMVYKKEFFRCVAGEFVMSCVLGLKKVGNIQKAGTTTSSKRSYTKNSATKTSSASTKNTSVKATKK